ncbi:MAG: PspC domain-containing protein [Candidatus Kryptonium sp.]
MKRLYKSRHDKIIDGVCGGIGEYLGIDPVIVRIIFILLFFMGGVGLLLYIAGMLIIPANPEHAKEQPQVEPKRAGKGVLFILGIILIIVGVGLLLENFGWPFWHFFKVGFNYILPLLLIAAGIFLIVNYMQRKRNTSILGAESGSEKIEMETETGGEVKRLFRSRKNRMIFGICGGLGEYFNTDPTVIRILWVILGISSLGIAILLYLIMAIIVPEEPTS